MGRFHLSVKELNIDLHLPPTVVRAIVAGGVACVIAIGVIYSRGDRPDVSVGPKGVIVKHPKNIEQQREAEIYSKPTPTDRLPLSPMVADADKSTKPGPQKQVPIPESERRPARIATGYYFERVRVQGDSDDEEYVIIRRPCLPANMPEVCYLPQSQRASRPFERY